VRDDKEPVDGSSVADNLIPSKERHLRGVQRGCNFSGMDNSVICRQIIRSAERKELGMRDSNNREVFRPL
jgi:hypothetical protein